MVDKDIAFQVQLFVFLMSIEEKVVCTFFVSGDKKEKRFRSIQFHRSFLSGNVVEILSVVVFFQHADGPHVGPLGAINPLLHAIGTLSTFFLYFSSSLIKTLQKICLSATKLLAANLKWLLIIDHQQPLFKVATNNQLLAATLRGR